MAWTGPSLERGVPAHRRGVRCDPRGVGHRWTSGLSPQRAGRSRRRCEATLRAATSGPFLRSHQPGARDRARGIDSGRRTGSADPRCRGCTSVGTRTLAQRLLAVAGGDHRQQLARDAGRVDPAVVAVRAVAREAIRVERKVGRPRARATPRRTRARSRRGRAAVSCPSAASALPRRARQLRIAGRRHDRGQACARAADTAPPSLARSRRPSTRRRRARSRCRARPSARRCRRPCRAARYGTRKRTPVACESIISAKLGVRARSGTWSTCRCRGCRSGSPGSLAPRAARRSRRPTRPSASPRPMISSSGASEPDRRTSRSTAASRSPRRTPRSRRGALMAGVAPRSVSAAAPSAAPRRRLASTTKPARRASALERVVLAQRARDQAPVAARLHSVRSAPRAAPCRRRRGARRSTRRSPVPRSADRSRPRARRRAAPLRRTRSRRSCRRAPRRSAAPRPHRNGRRAWKKRQ